MSLLPTLTSSNPFTIIPPSLSTRPRQLETVSSSTAEPAEEELPDGLAIVVARFDAAVDRIALASPEAADCIWSRPWDYSLEDAERIASIPNLVARRAAADALIRTTANLRPRSNP